MDAQQVKGARWAIAHADAPVRWCVLWIDDEVRFEDGFVQLMGFEGVRVELADSGAAGLAKARTGSYDAIVVDLRLPDMFGMTVLQRLLATETCPPVLVITGYYHEPEVEDRALREGAAAFRRKPLNVPDEVTNILRSIIDARRAAQGGSQSTTSPFRIVGSSEAMRSLVAWIERVGPTRSPVLITGETGTGKELVARGLHRASPRQATPFVAVNCAAIAEHLVETELFGYCTGAFPSAVSDKEGVFETADGGTLFLDHVADLPLSVQAHLLRFLELGEVRRIGEVTWRRLDVRVLSATNRGLRDEIERGRFRADLYYRLAVQCCQIPPLRERLEDIEPLVANWRSSVEQASQLAADVSPGVFPVLRAHSWPGNVRELRNVLEQAASLAAGGCISARAVAALLANPAASIPLTPPEPAPSAEVQQVLTALDEHHWNHTAAASALGISRTTLWRMLRRYGLRRREPT